MRVIIIGEESQEICKAFRKLGHEAYSNDFKDCSGGHPEWHIKGDGRKWLDNSWDLMVAHPPCTHLAVSGARWFQDKIEQQKEAIEFFMEMVNAPIAKKCIEQPISIMSTKYRKPDQIIQPWMFGHGEVKATCLWLFGLPKLIPTNLVEGREARIHKMPPSEKRSELRSKTYPGIAKAMAEQWGATIR